MGSANEIDGSDDNASEATIGIRESDSVIELATMATRTQ